MGQSYKIQGQPLKTKICRNFSSKTSESLEFLLYKVAGSKIIRYILDKGIGGYGEPALKWS